MRSSPTLNAQIPRPKQKALRTEVNRKGQASLQGQMQLPKGEFKALTVRPCILVHIAASFDTSTGKNAEVLQEVP